MDEKKALQAVQKAKEGSQKRNFTQTFDLIINLKGLDLKKPDQQVDLFITLHFPRGKKAKICALIGPELKEEAKICDTVVLVDDFPKYDKKKVKKLAQEHVFFIAQANIMAKVAQAFGKILGPRGKMPNPKAGCVVPPKAALKPLYDKLQKTVRLQAKTALIIHCTIGNEKMQDKEIAENIVVVYNQLTHVLSAHENNIKSILLKTTMGKPVEIK